MSSPGKPPQMPKGMTRRKIERGDDRLIVEFQRKSRATTKVELKLLDPDRLEVLSLESRPVSLAASEAVRRTWKRVQSDLGKGGKSVAEWIEMLEHESEAVRLEAMISASLSSIRFRKRVGAAPGGRRPGALARGVFAHRGAP